MRMGVDMNEFRSGIILMWVYFLGWVWFWYRRILASLVDMDGIGVDRNCRDWMVVDVGIDTDGWSCG